MSGLKRWAVGYCAAARSGIAPATLRTFHYLHGPRERGCYRQTDLVTNATWGSYEKGLAWDFTKLLPKFDREGDRLHGLTHLSIHAEADAVHV